MGVKHANLSSLFRTQQLEKHRSAFNGPWHVQGKPIKIASCQRCADPA